MQSKPTFFRCARSTRSTIIAFFLAVSGHALILYLWQHHQEHTNHMAHEPSTGPVLNFSLVRENDKGKPRSVEQTKIDNKKINDGRDLSETHPVFPSDNNAPPNQHNRDTTYYFKPDEVDTKPSIVVDLPNDFSLPVNLGIPQRLIMTLRISATGDVDDVEITDDLINKQALQVVVDKFKELRFEAARIGDSPVASEMRIEVFGGFLP